MFLYFLTVIFLGQGSCCETILVHHSAPAATQRRSSNTKAADWKVIASLTNQAYSEYDQDKEKGHKRFAEAAGKLEAYIKNYETDPGRASYLRALVSLGALYQNADHLDQAKAAFEQCERHAEFNSPAATLRVMEGGRQIQQTIANYVKARLCFLTKCEKPEHRAAYEVVRITGGGSSRGEEIAPPVSFKDIKRHRHRRSR